MKYFHYVYILNILRLKTIIDATLENKYITSVGALRLYFCETISQPDNFANFNKYRNPYLFYIFYDFSDYTNM